MFHLVDNTTLEGSSNKMAKVMLLYDHLNSSFIKYGIFHKLLSIDESMVPYYGRHSCKMFIRSKPIRFGYKLWCLCGADGYPYYMTIYTGRAENSTGPLGSHVVNEKVDVILQNSDPLKHEFFFDNFFTNYHVLADLPERNIKAIGIVRENRTLGASGKMKSIKQMKKVKEEHLTFAVTEFYSFVSGMIIP